MDISLISRLPKDYQTISMIPTINKPKSAFYQKKKVPPLSDSPLIRYRSKTRSLHRSTNDIKIQINNKSNLWCEYKISGKLPPTRSFHSVAFSHAHLYVYGGYDYEFGILSDFYQIKLPLDEKYLQWELIKATGQSPGPLCRHGSLYYEEKVYIYGGQAHCIIDSNKLFSYDIKTNEWNFIETKVSPPVSESFALTENSKDHRFYIFGGFNSTSGEFNNDLYCFDMHGHFWKKIQYKSEKNPKGRAGHSCAMYKDSIYMFGGEIIDMKFNDFWIFDLNTYCWQQVQGDLNTWPCERSGHSLINYNDNLIIFGGLFNKMYEKNDLYIYSILQNKWLLWELDSIIKKEPDESDYNDKKPREINKILNNNSNFSIFSKHIKNSLSLSPLKKNAHAHSSLFLEKKDDKFLSVDYNIERNQRGVTAFAKNSGFEVSPSCRSLVSNEKKLLTSGFGLSVDSVPQVMIDSNAEKSNNGNKPLSIFSSNDLKTRRISQRILNSGDQNRNILTPNRNPSPNESLPKILKNSSSFIIKSNKSMELMKKNQYKPINLSISAVQTRIIEGRKKILLKQFEINDERLRDQLLIKNSPTSDMMKQIITYMTEKNIEENKIDNGSHGPKPRITAVKFNKKFPTLYGKILGNRPCARDGHAGVVLGRKMVIFGGNRHKIGFNDIYELDMEKLI